MNKEVLDKLTIEKQELIEKKEKLDKYIKSEDFNKLGEVQKVLLNLQVNVLDNYTDILNYRIIDLYNKDLGVVNDEKCK